MEAAEKWCVPPYKIAGGSKLLWFARFHAVREMEYKRAENTRRKRELERMSKKGKRK